MLLLRHTWWPHARGGRGWVHGARVEVWAYDVLLGWMLWFLGLRLRRGEVEVLRRGRREGRVEGLGWWGWFLVLGSWNGWMDVCGMCSRVFSHAW